MKILNNTKNYFIYGLFYLFIMSISAQNKVFYGVTNSGGTANRGVIFKTDANGENYTVVHNFDGENGSRPDNCKLTYVNGWLYGTTGSGGVNDMGVLFQYNPSTEIYVKLHDFDGIDTGRSPYSNVILASNGKLYGTTLNGGLNDFGVLFEFDLTTNNLTKKLDFDGGKMGKNLYASVIQAANGNLYGVTNQGGTNAGVLYEYDYTSEVFTKLIDFEAVTLGRGPTILVEVENNVLYGTCSSGGVNSNGTIFEYVISTNTITKKFDFDSNSSGSQPPLSLMKASNGKLYGLTRYGGANNLGVLYEYNMTTEAFTTKFDFRSETGNFFGGTLLEATNGNLYGLTQNGGLNGDGTIFEFNISTDQFNKKFDFSRSSGSDPKGGLIEIDESILGNTDFIHNSAEVIFWPNPVNDIMNLKNTIAFPFRTNIFNLLGQEIKSDENFKTDHLLNVSHLKTGIYILTIIYQNGNTEAIKFIKN